MVIYKQEAFSCLYPSEPSSSLYPVIHKYGNMAPNLFSSAVTLLPPACSRVFADKEALMAGALEVAGEIAARSPVAVQGTKLNLIYSRDHSVAEGLHYMVRALPVWA